MRRAVAGFVFVALTSIAAGQTGDVRPATQPPPPPPSEIKVKPGSPKTQTIALAELEKKVWFLTFPPNQRATIRVTSELDTDVDLYMDDLEGREIVNDVGEPKDCEISFVPLKPKIYRVAVINIGPGANRCKFEHTGSEAVVDFGTMVELKPFDVDENKNKDIDVVWEAGKLVGIWVGADKASDVDVHVFGPDDREVAKDEQYSKDSVVTFRVPRSGAYRIEVRNLGPGANRCHVRHTASSANVRPKPDPIGDLKTADPKKGIQ